MFKIRAATEQDASAIAHVHVQSWRTTYTGAIREPIQNYDAELFTIYLLQHAQQNGIGTGLLKALAKSLGMKGYNSMVAWVLESNPSSHFYDKTGALPISSKQIEIGGTPFTELAYGWPDLNALVRPQSTPKSSF